MQVVPAGLGRRPDLDAELEQLGDRTFTAGRVLAQHRARWLVAGLDGATRLVPARGRLRAGDRPTTGDWVALDGDGAIAAVLQRRGTVVRRAAGGAFASQVLAANVDLVLVVEPLPEPEVRRAERLVALALAGGVPAALALTKADLDPAAAEVARSVGGRLGVADALAVSIHDEESVAAVSALLARDTTTVVLGPSGAGKSTLVNALMGVDRQAVGAVRASDGRGRHTTVTRELLTLPGGALLIDTPGIREAGLWDGVGGAFADIEALAARCRFNDCGHAGEPGCAVLAEGDPERVAAWRKLELEQAWLEDRRRAARDRGRLGRRHARTVREARHAKGDEG
ncbi:MAG: ribosome biosis GTPase / thiamine phosphate phosphatase [Solirubrobacteraceae bacterium]|jgi:ribosome biogenesis GTPase|nr:ribosome biosis GTPase / thiamine phosphate phosphatase [Solirubrobacteraceae bacterium]